MSTDTQTTFTADDLPALVAAQDQIAAFKTFLLDRFIAWTATTDAVDSRGRAIQPVTDAAGKTSGGWGSWRLGHDRLTADAEWYRFEHWLADERAPSIQTATANMPVSFVFLPEDEQADYQRFLALKARFEPGA